MNLMQYFHGLKDFGCTLQTSGDTKLRWFEYRSRDAKSPIFQCKLINEVVTRILIARLMEEGLSLIAMDHLAMNIKIIHLVLKPKQL